MALGAKEAKTRYSLINGIQKIRLSGAEKRFFARWLGEYTESRRLTFSPPFMVRAENVLTLAVSLFSAVLLYFLAAKSDLAQSEYIAFTVAYGTMLGAVRGMADSFLSVGRINPTLKMLDGFLQAEPETSGSRQLVMELNGGIELNNVYFRYSTNAPYIRIYPIAVHTAIPPSGFYAFLSSYAILTGALTMISASAVNFADALPVFRMLKPVMDFAPEIDGKKEVVQRLRGNISLQNVTFRYSERLPPVLENLNIEIRRSEYVGIVGTTGCGKSTIFRLLLGFETPDHGEILYDGKKLSSLDVTSLRRKIGTVLQNGEVFQGTILSNITVSGTNLTEDDAWRAAEIAGIADDIRRMPMKMNTPLPDSGRGISGGQKQRLLIARAVATKPSVLFFDEATSALDNVTQKAVSDAIGEMNCTRVVIAHRLSTVQNCDRILCLDQGHIVEEGTYEELMQKDGFFAELVKRQQI